MTVLTKWEAGQCLIDISDKIANVIDDLDAVEYQELRKELDGCMARIGDLFDRNNDHSFGIYNTNSHKRYYKL